MTDTAEAAPTTAGIGGNNPPKITAAEALRNRLAEQFDDFTTRRDELLAAAARAPVVINDEETAGKTTDFIRQISAAMKNAEGVRVSEKEPFLESGRTVDGFFKAITDPLKQAKINITSVLTRYQRKVADEERRVREEAERKAREEAERKAEAAREAEQAAQDTTGLDHAIAAEEAAKKAKADAIEAQRKADAKAADMTQTRGDFGGHASLRTSWEFEVTDFDAIPLENLRRHIPRDGIEKGIRAYVKAGGRELKGVRIYEYTKSVVR